MNHFPLKHYKSKNKSRAGLVLAEALLSVAALTTGVVILGTIISNASSSTKVSRDYLLAKHLATEAIEAVKNVRDTNWLRFPKDPNCWLAAGNSRDSNCAVSEVKAGPTASEYIPVQDAGVWDLEQSAGAPLDLNTLADDTYVLYNDNGQLKNSTTDIGEETMFYRSIHFLEENTTIDPVSGDEIKSDTTVLIKVQWLDGAKVSTLERKIKLYNFL